LACLTTPARHRGALPSCLGPLVSGHSTFIGGRGPLVGGHGTTLASLGALQAPSRALQPRLGALDQCLHSSPPRGVELGLILARRDPLPPLMLDVSHVVIVAHAALGATDTNVLPVAT
jgi:hypothetical protein